MRVWLNSKVLWRRGVSAMAVIKIIITNIILFKLQWIHCKVFVESLEGSELCKIYRLVQNFDPSLNVSQ